MQCCLFDILCKVFGRACVSKEVVVSPPNLRSSVRADLVLRRANTQDIWIDVSIVSPSCNKYLVHGSDEQALVAASAMESVKRAKYEPARNALGRLEESVVPFVIESSGRLGKSALNFIDLVKAARPQAATIPFSMKRIQAVIAQFNAKVSSRAAFEMMAVPGFTQVEPTQVGFA